MANVQKDYVIGSGAVVPVLKGIDLTVEPGEYVAIMGASGAGKSTLMNIIGTLDRPSRGLYMLDGEPIGELTDVQVSKLRNQTIGFVFQGFNLLPRRTLIDNVGLALLYGGEPVREREERAKYYLDQMGLGKYYHYRPGQLSGGQQQRVAIARALAGEPKLILADEPTGSLDSTTTKDIMNVFEELYRQGMTIVMVTHEDDVAMCAKRLIQLKDGEIVYDGPMF